jgi:hypothetical protein
MCRVDASRNRSFETHPTDGEIQKLSAVESDSSAAAVRGTVDHERVRTSASDRRRLAGNVAELHLKRHASIIGEADLPRQGPSSRPAPGARAAAS